MIQYLCVLFVGYGVKRRSRQSFGNNHDWEEYGRNLGKLIVQKLLSKNGPNCTEFSTGVTVASPGTYRHSSKNKIYSAPNETKRYNIY
jgi:hypothetical protein